MDEGGASRPDVPGGTVKIEEQLLDRVCKGMDNDFASSMMRLDLETYLPGDILTKVDRTSMAVSLEARVPLLDFDLVDFAFELPSSLRVSEVGSKILFRRAIRGSPLLTRHFQWTLALCDCRAVRVRLYPRFEQVR